MHRAAGYIANKQGTILKVFLGLVFALFIGILVMVYFVAKQANPILLDEHGNPTNIGKK